MEHAADKWPAAIFIVVWSLAILVAIIRAQRGKNYFIRRIPGLNAIDEAVGRATEMGRPILMVPGLSGIGVVGIQALAIFSYIIKTAAKFGNRIILPTADPALYTVAEEVVRDSYNAAGRPEDFDPNSVYFLSDRQFAFASGVAGTIFREKVAASFMFGDFFAESLIFAETGNQVGAIQVAGTVQVTQIPFFIAACDYTIIGDEYYAASAYISREPTLLGSLVGQDFCKALIVLAVIIGTIAISIPQLGPGWFFIKWFTLG